jgi:mannose-6-phosphate isomerase-like protein (cupin superfamily)
VTALSPIDLAASRARRVTVKNDRILAELALTRCEQALMWRDWPQFRYWHEIYVSVRKRGNLLVRTPAQDAATGGEHNIQQHQHAERRGKLTEAKEVVMRYAKIGMALVAITLAATPVPAQTTSYSSSSNATVIASATLPSVTSSPLYMRVVGGRIIENRIAAVSTASGIYYQLSGTVALTMNGEPRTIHQNEGIFIPAGANLVVSPVGDDPVIYLQFLLSPLAYFDVPDLSPVNGRELYRSASAIPGLKNGTYVVNLKRVTLPYQAPPDLPHHRSGAALHLVLSGFGAETANGIAVAKGPGSLSYEPAPTVYQWSNPGNIALTYLVFNINPSSEDAVLANAFPTP